MKYVQIDPDVQVISRLSFGTASLHHHLLRRSRIRLLECALDSGFTHFDTSPYYGYGQAEADLGHFLRGRRSSVTIATKIGLYPRHWPTSSPGLWVRKALDNLCRSRSRFDVDWRPDFIANMFEESLNRLRTDHVDILWLHEPMFAHVPAEELLAWYHAEKRRGRLLSWGLAGDPQLCEPWLARMHPLARLLQTRDDLATKPADIIRQCGRELQFTYGYLSNRSSTAHHSPLVTLAGALARNASGSVIVSTRSVDRIRQLSALAA